MTPATTPQPPSLLLAGFTPFARYACNPSGDIARDLNHTRLANGAPVRGLVLPVTYTAPLPLIRAAVNSEGDRPPTAILLTGLAAGIPRPKLETRARNIHTVNSTLAPIREAGPPEYITPINVHALHAHLHRHRHRNPHSQVGSALSPQRVDISTDAGSFVCNYTYYLALHHYTLLGIPVLFLHIPEHVTAASRQLVHDTLLYLAHRYHKDISTTQS